MHEHSVALVIGTRPEAIKLAPVLQALRRRSSSVHLLLTGQHPIDPEDFGLNADSVTRLCWPLSSTPHRAVGLAAEAIGQALGQTGVMLVQGDTSSALAGARAAYSRGIPVGHVEAGLRSHDPLRPWPEEEFRIEIDRIASLLFAPTELSAANLRREGVAGDVHVTGNTVVDALIAKRLRRSRRVATRQFLITCHRRESWGEGLDRIAAATRQLAAAGLGEVRFVLHPNRRVAAQMTALLGGTPSITLAPPCGHEEMLAAMASADLILSDSGGMQEEAAVMGVPLLVLRDATERPEGMVSGNLKLVGTDPDRILRMVKRMMTAAGTRPTPAAPDWPYGDGNAAERIAAIIEGRVPIRRMSVRTPAAAGLNRNQDLA